jgi:hypothetical protein
MNQVMAFSWSSKDYGVLVSKKKQQKLDGLIKGSKWDKARVLLGNLLMLQDFV